MAHYAGATVEDLTQGSVEDDVQLRLRAAREALSGESATECEDCGETIPEARRVASPGCKCCIQCAAKREEQPRANPFYKSWSIV